MPQKTGADMVMDFIWDVGMMFFDKFDTIGKALGVIFGFAIALSILITFLEWLGGSNNGKE